MALIRPPITGDPQLDSWTDQLTRQINQGILPGTGAVVEGGGGGAAQGPRGNDGINGNSVLYLYQRTQTDTAPATPTDQVVYNFANDPVVAAAVNGWTSSLPSGAAGPYLWVTFVYVSEQMGTVLTGWDSPTLLGLPGDDAVTVIITTHRLPTGVTAADFDPANPGTLRASSSGFQFRDNMGEAKVLRADVYVGGVEMTPESDWIYTWTRNGVSVPTNSNIPMRATNTRYLVIDATDIDDGGEDVFSCEVEDPS